MPALNFSIFVDKVENKTKKQTIRVDGKRIILPGDKLFLYTDMRTKKCRKIGVSWCTHVIPLYFVAAEVRHGYIIWQIMLDGKVLDYISATQLARQDGFDDLEGMLKWFIFKYNLETMARRWQYIDNTQIVNKRFNVIRWE